MKILIEQEKDSSFLLDRLLEKHDTKKDDKDGRDKVQDNQEVPDFSDEDDMSSQASDGEFSRLENITEFLTDGLPFESYKRNLRHFIAESTPTPKPAKRGFIQYLGLLTKILVPRLSWYTKIMRPNLTKGYRRIEWTCDCGVELYADFRDQYTEHIERLAHSLKNPVRSGIEVKISNSDGFQSTNTPGEVGKVVPIDGGQHDQQRSSNSSDSDTTSGNWSGPRSSDKQALHSSATVSSSEKADIDLNCSRIKSRFLALCVNTGGIYKTLTEIDIEGIRSDAIAFLKMKEAYLGTRGLRSRFNFLIKPVGLEFVQFTLWNRKHGYVSICNRPESIPPQTMRDYEYIPRPLEPLPPMPPEIFIHYLEHGEGELNAARYDWLPRLPVRLGERVIDGEEACYGWGIHVIEGPNRVIIFWTLMTTLLAGILTCTLWSALNQDIQGGTSLGALIVALPSAVLVAFLFRSEGV